MVELIVGMAVTSILLLGITGVVFAANNAYSSWIDRIETSGTGDVLAASLAADSHRYVSCPTSTSQHLDFCLPGSCLTNVGTNDPCPQVSYQMSPAAPFTVTRVVGQGSGNRLLVRDLNAPLKFYVTCTEAANVDVGFISVLGLPGRADLRVYFQSATGECESVLG
jgi:hypothetical protein